MVDNVALADTKSICLGYKILGRYGSLFMCAFACVSTVVDFSPFFFSLTEFDVMWGDGWEMDLWFWTRLLLPLTEMETLPPFCACGKQFLFCVCVCVRCEQKTVALITFDTLTKIGANGCLIEVWTEHKNEKLKPFFLALFLFTNSEDKIEDFFRCVCVQFYSY